MKKALPSRISHLRYLVNSFIDQELTKRDIHDLRTSYGGIIYHLQINKSLTMKELAEKIDRDKSTLTVLIKKLNKGGYVSLSVNELDKRSKIVSITKKGMKIKQHFEDISDSLYEKLWLDISEYESDMFEDVLNKLIKNLENEVEK